MTECKSHLNVVFIDEANELFTINLFETIPWEIFRNEPWITDTVVTNQIHSMGVTPYVFIFKAEIGFRSHTSFCGVFFFLLVHKCRHWFHRTLFYLMMMIMMMICIRKIHTAIRVFIGFSKINFSFGSGTFFTSFTLLVILWRCVQSFILCIRSSMLFWHI